MAPDGDVRTAADSRHDHGLVVGAAVVNGVSGYLVLLIAARTLSPAENADFLVFWGALFALFGVLVGIAGRGHPRGARDQPRLRRVRRGRQHQGAAGRRPGSAWSPPPLGGGLRAPVGRPPLRRPGAALDGAARRRRRALPRALRDRRDRGGAGTLGDLRPARRARPAGAAGAGGRPPPRSPLGQDGLVAASALAAAYWLVLVALRRPDLGWSDAGRCSTRAVSSAGSSAPARPRPRSAVLLVGFPVLVRATSPDAEFAAAAPLLLAVSLCRAPLLVPLSVYQNVVVTRVMTPRARGPARPGPAGRGGHRRRHGRRAPLDRPLGPAPGQPRLPRRAGDAWRCWCWPPGWSACSP